MLRLRAQAACIMLGDPVPHRLHWPRFSEFSVSGHRMAVYRRNANQAAGENVRDDAMSVDPYVYPGRAYFALRCRDSKRRALPLHLWGLESGVWQTVALQVMQQAMPHLQGEWSLVCGRLECSK